MYKYHSDNVGEFTEVDYGHCFTYRKTTDAWAIKNGLPYEVDVAFDKRFANITKSRCYMAIDEDAEGKPVIERWSIRKHIKFNNS